MESRVKHWNDFIVSSVLILNLSSQMKIEGVSDIHSFTNLPNMY